MSIHCGVTFQLDVYFEFSLIYAGQTNIQWTFFLVSLCFLTVLYNVDSFTNFGSVIVVEPVERKKLTFYNLIEHFNKSLFLLKRKCVTIFREYEEQNKTRRR